MVTWPSDYTGRFIPGVVVRLSSGAQGYVTSVGAGGASFKVKIGVGDIDGALLSLGVRSEECGGGDGHGE